MTQAAERHAILRSGPLVLDRRQRRLTRAGQAVPISGLPARILELLMAANGELVTRAELKQALWPYATRIDTERRLNTGVRALREALGDTAMTPRYVATVRGLGYRWVGGAEPPAARRHGWRIAALALALLVVRSDWAIGVPAGAESRPAPLAAARIAVDNWREHPDARRLSAAEASLEQARRLGGPSAELDSLAADLALAADWDWARAEALYQRAVINDPASTAAHRGLAWLYVNRGTPERAWPHIARLLATSAPDADARADLGWLILRAGKPDVALGLCTPQSARHVNLLSCRHTALARLGYVDSARQVAAELLHTLKADPSVIAKIRTAPPEQAYRRFLAWRVKHFVPRHEHWFVRAQLQAEAGMLADAIASLERAAARRDPLMIKIGSTFAFEGLAGSSRFQRLSAQVLRRA